MTRRTYKKMTANYDNTDCSGSSACVNDCSNCVGIDKEPRIWRDGICKAGRE